MASKSKKKGRECDHNRNEYNHPDFGCEPCPKCPPGMGKDTTENPVYEVGKGNTSCAKCVACREGFYSKTYSYECRLCRDCAAKGRVTKAACTAKSNTTCRRKGQTTTTPPLLPPAPPSGENTTLGISNPGTYREEILPTAPEGKNTDLSAEYHTASLHTAHVFISIAVSLGAIVVLVAIFGGVFICRWREKRQRQRDHRRESCFLERSATNKSDRLTPTVQSEERFEESTIATEQQKFQETSDKVTFIHKRQKKCTSRRPDCMKSLADSSGEQTPLLDYDSANEKMSPLSIAQGQNRPPKFQRMLSLPCEGSLKEVVEQKRRQFYDNHASPISSCGGSLETDGPLDPHPAQPETLVSDWSKEILRRWESCPTLSLSEFSRTESVAGESSPPDTPRENRWEDFGGKKAVEKDFQLVSKKLGRNYADVGRRLGLDDNCLDAIASDFKDSCQEQAYRTLLKWSQKCGNEATIEKLCDALEYCERNDIIDSLIKEHQNEKEHVIV